MLPPTTGFPVELPEFPVVVLLLELVVEPPQPATIKLSALTDARTANPCLHLCLAKQNVPLLRPMRMSMKYVKTIIPNLPIESSGKSEIISTYYTYQKISSSYYVTVLKLLIANARINKHIGNINNEVEHNHKYGGEQNGTHNDWDVELIDGVIGQNPNPIPVECYFE